MWPRYTPIALLELLMLVSPSHGQFNNPPGVDIWCGKAYREGNASFNPGGWFEEPAVGSTPLLRLKAKPRLSIYLDTDANASVLVDAEISYQLGEAISESVVTASPPQPLQVTILTENATLLSTASVDVGSTNNDLPIDLSALTARLDPYNLTITATLSNTTVYSTSTNFSYLPYPTTNGSIARLDNLNGGISAHRGGPTAPWTALYPYTYYVQWSLYWDANLTTLEDFAAMGYNVIHIVPTGTLGESPFPWSQFQPYLDRAAELGLWLQYDVLWTPDNTTSQMVEQVERLRSHPSILSWYQSDEADGKGNPVASTGEAYRTLKQLDPYHPVSLALNCYDFYYSEYAAGADIIAPDVYPISNNVTFSTVYNTVCNATYGCCGCDDCGVGPTVFSDISARLDEFRRRDGVLGWSKTQWFAPQAFGNETFWTRYPTAGELAVMTLLAVNHGAKGITMWDFPTTAELSTLTTNMSTLFTGPDFASFLIGAATTRYQNLTVVKGGANIDAAAWVDEASGTAAMSVVNLDYGAVAGPVTIRLPAAAVTAVGESLWGNSAWEVGEEDGTVSIEAGLEGLETAVFLVTIA